MFYETKSQREEGDAGEETPDDSLIHGLGVRAVSKVTGEPYTPEEVQDIIRDAGLSEPFASSAQTPPREYKGDDPIPFGD